MFGTLVLGAHAYGVTELEGGGLEHIVKQLGYGDDPLNQRASVGWKGDACRRASGGAVHGAHRERVQLFRHCGGKLETTRKERAMAEKKKNVRIRLFKDNSRYKGDLFVSVNGVNYKIRRGVEVEVPPEVAEVLEHSQQQDEHTAARIAAAETAAQ